jgi:hypothetical protein
VPWRIGGLVTLHVQGWRKEQVRVERTRDSATIELPITVPPAGQYIVTYSVRYTW